MQSFGKEIEDTKVKLPSLLANAFQIDFPEEAKKVIDNESGVLINGIF
jgi:hypothetical protein